VSKGIVFCRVTVFQSVKLLNSSEKIGRITDQNGQIFEELQERKVDHFWAQANYPKGEGSLVRLHNRYLQSSGISEAWISFVECYIIALWHFIGDLIRRSAVIVIKYYSSSLLESLHITFNYHLGTLTQAIADNGFLYATVQDLPYPFG